MRKLTHRSETTESGVADQKRLWEGLAASFWAGSMAAGKKPVKVSLRLAALDL